MLMNPRRISPTVAGLIGFSLLAAACGVDASIAIERSDQITADTSSTGDPVFSESDDDLDGSVPDEPTDEPIDEPVDPPSTVPADPVVTDPEAIDFGDEKPVRDRDAFLLAAFADVEAWLAAEFEPVFGIPFVPLEGEVYAGYPERTDPIPGCGNGEFTSYDDLSQFAAFYCPIGDFIAYDDGDGGLLDQLSDEYGPATIGIVLAHEYGHAIQERIGALDRRLPTVITEQQADCIAGAWAGRAAAGQAPGVPFTEADVRASLIAMIQVQDPVGSDPTGPGGHGSGFDRVGAFQEGFAGGLAACEPLLDDPLPLTPLAFLNQDDLLSGGNAVFGFESDELFGFLVPDLNAFFGIDQGDRFPAFEPLVAVPTQDGSDVSCAAPIGDYDDGVVLCLDDATVFLNIPRLAILYDEFGDFAPGFLLGVAWAEAALTSTDSPVTGEARQLLADCLVGGWVRSATPLLDDFGNFVVDDEGFPVTAEPRTEERTALISPNDLTEAIQTAIVIGDPTTDTDDLGSAFEKIDAFRLGTLGGPDACS